MLHLNIDRFFQLLLSTVQVYFLWKFEIKNIISLNSILLNFRFG